MESSPEALPAEALPTEPVESNLGVSFGSVLAVVLLSTVPDPSPFLPDGSVWRKRADTLLTLLVAHPEGLSVKELAAKAKRLPGFAHTKTNPWCMTTHVVRSLRRLAQAGLVSKEAGHCGRWRLVG